RELADLARDVGEPLARLCRTRRLDRAADGQHARLHAYQRNRVDDLLDFAARHAEPSHDGNAVARAVEARAHAVNELLDGLAAGLELRVDGEHAIVRLSHAPIREPRALLDLSQRGRSLLRRARLHLRGP